LVIFLYLTTVLQKSKLLVQKKNVQQKKNA